MPSSQAAPKSHPIKDPDAYAKEFVEAYNQGHENVHGFYSDQLDWLELPTGRKGGKKEYVEALYGVRDVLTDLKLTQVIRFASGGNLGVLETQFAATTLGDEPAPLNALLVWVWTFDEDGLITSQHDYFLPLTEEPAPYL